MSSFKVFDIAGSGMSAESVRLNTVASNLANADSVSGDPTQVYQAKHPVFQSVQALGAAASLVAGPRMNPADGLLYDLSLSLTPRRPGRVRRRQHRGPRPG